MEHSWNSWQGKPAVSTVKTYLYSKEINELKDVLFNILKTFKNLECLKIEAALLSKFLNKHKRAFRHDKGYKNLSKMNQCLKRYFKINLYDDVNSVKQCFPPHLQSAGSHVYLPTRQMLKWILFRFLPFSQICNRLINLSKQAGSYFHGKLSLGWSTNLSLIAFCIAARVLIISKFLLSKAIEWYSSLYKCLPYLDLTVDFLPNFKLPPDLKEWLGDVDLSFPKPKKSIDEIFEIIDLVKENDDEEVEIVNEKLTKFLEPRHAQKISGIEENEVEIIQHCISNVGDNLKKRKHLLKSLQSEDLGVPVKDDEEESPVKKKFKKNKMIKKIK